MTTVPETPAVAPAPPDVGRLQALGRMCLQEVGAERPHVAVVVDDHVAVDGVLGQPGGDLVAPIGAGRARGSLVQHAAGEPSGVQHLLQLGDGLAVPPGGRDDDVRAAARHDLVQHPDAGRVQIPVAIPAADRGQHTVDVEKDHPPRRCAHSFAG